MKIEDKATMQVLSSLLTPLRERCQTKPTLPGFDVVVDLVVYSVQSLATKAIMPRVAPRV